MLFNRECGFDNELDLNPMNDENVDKQSFLLYCDIRDLVNKLKDYDSVVSCEKKEKDTIILNWENNLYHSDMKVIEKDYTVMILNFIMYAIIAFAIFAFTITWIVAIASLILAALGVD
jgi:hypothetical protein